MTATDNRAGWWSRAACLTSEPDLFFPVSSCGPALRQVARAKEVCARCQIQQACLDYALDAEPVRGIWGGTTEEERAGLLSKRRRSAATSRSTVLGAARECPALAQLKQPARG
jgi:WhiB family transcriptional regulator, redox-sensing transcriptional regulator